MNSSDASFSPEDDSSNGDSVPSPSTSAADTTLGRVVDLPDPNPAPVAAPGHHLIDTNSANDTIELDLIDGFAQTVNWGVAGASSMIIDEPEPLGKNRGPSPARVLASALASCLSASLLFCLRKARVDVFGLHATASVALKRNEKGRLRVGTITVVLEPVVPIDQQAKMARCVETFEDYCIITASVRPSVTVNVSVNAVSPPAH